MTKQQRRKAGQRKKNNPFWIWGIATLLVLGLFSVWFATKGTSQSNTYPQEISVSEALAKKEAGAFILDVREPSEWNEFHVPGATLIPLGELASRVNELPRDREVIVICRTGHRSAQGRDILLSAGFTQVTSVAGGITQWKAAGYPTVSGP